MKTNLQGNTKKIFTLKFSTSILRKIVNILRCLPELKETNKGKFVEKTRHLLCPRAPRMTQPSSRAKHASPHSKNKNGLKQGILMLDTLPNTTDSTNGVRTAYLLSKVAPPPTIHYVTTAYNFAGKTLCDMAKLVTLKTKTAKVTGSHRTTSS